MEMSMVGNWTQKRGNSAEEYEDSFNGDTKLCRFAVADGASDSYASRVWADLLTSAFIQEQNRSIFESQDCLLVWARDLSERWHSEIPWSELAWYQLEKAEYGSHATFLGLELGEFKIPNSSPEKLWQAIAVGDSCLFQVRNDELVTSPFPITSPEAFNTTPPLISSLEEYNSKSLECTRFATGTYLIGDVFLLMTDALAHWFIEQVSIGLKPWQELLNLEPDTFTQFVSQLRKSKSLRNDDVTLLTVQLELEEKLHSPNKSQTLNQPNEAIFKGENEQSDFDAPARKGTKVERHLLLIVFFIVIILFFRLLAVNSMMFVINLIDTLISLQA